MTSSKSIRSRVVWCAHLTKYVMNWHASYEGARERAFNELQANCDALYKTLNSLRACCQTAGLECTKHAAFTCMGGPGIASNDKVLRAAFSDALLQDGTASDRLN